MIMNDKMKSIFQSILHKRLSRKGCRNDYKPKHKRNKFRKKKKRDPRLSWYSDPRFWKFFLITSWQI